MSDIASTTPADPAPEADEQQTFSLDYVKSLRDEAAKHRTAKQAVVEELTAKHEKALADAQAEFDVKSTEFQAQLSSKDIEVAKLRAAFDLKVPADKLDSFLETVKGSTPDEVRESAKKLSDLVGGFQQGIPAIDPTQGTGNTHQPLNGNPLLHSLQQKLGIH